MTSTFTIGPIAVYIVLYLLLLVATAAFATGSAECGNLPGWACGSPFEVIAQANPQSQNLFTLAKGVVGGLFSLAYNFLVMDYDILHGEGAIVGGVGFVIRAIGWVLIMVTVGGIALQLFGRR